MTMFPVFSLHFTQALDRSCLGRPDRRVNILGTVNDTYQGALVIKAWPSALGLLQDVMMNVDFPIWYTMDSNKQLANVPSTTQRRVHRLSLIFLFSTATALVVCFFARALAEYTLCTPHERIYTVNNAQPRAHCITIRNDRISRIGAYGMSYSRTHHRIIPVEATLNQKMKSHQCQSAYLSQAGVTGFNNLLFPMSRLPILLCLGLLVRILTVCTLSDYKLTPIDAHAHVLGNGWMMQLPLTGTTSVQGRNHDPVRKLCPS